MADPKLFFETQANENIDKYNWKLKMPRRPEAKHSPNPTAIFDTLTFGLPLFAKLAPGPRTESNSALKPRALKLSRHAPRRRRTNATLVLSVYTTFECIYSFIHLFIYLYIHSFVHSFIHSAIHLFIHSFIYLDTNECYKYTIIT